MKKEKPWNSFEEFWPFYLSEHSHPTNRKLHLIGTSIALGLIVMGLFSFKLHLILLGLVFGYGFAWVGHFKIEKNRPATFVAPGWSARGDFRMWLLAVRGQLKDEIRRHNLPE